MIVCVCHRVSDREIARAVREGCPDFESLQEQLRVGTACGACLECARSTFDERRTDCGAEIIVMASPASRRIESATHG